MQSLEKCFFCKNVWGKCECKALPDGRFFINPFEYYGVDYTNYLKKQGEQHV